MTFYLSWYSVTLLFGYLNGMLLAVIFAAAAVSKRSLNKALLSVLLALGTQSTAMYMLGFAGIEIFWQELMFFPVGVGFLIGPTLFFYVKSLISNRFRLRIHDAIHLLPQLVYVFLFLLVYGQGQVYAHRFNEEVYIGYNLHVLRYLLEVGSQSYYVWAAFRLYQQYRNWAEIEYADPGRVSYSWLKMVLLASITGLTLSAGIELYDLFADLPFTQDWWSNVVVDVMVMYLGLSALAQPELKPNTFDFELRQENLTDETQAVISELTDTKADSQNNTVVLPDQQKPYQPEDWEKLKQYMVASKPYLDAELTLSALAELVGLKPRVLSLMINQEAQLNFSDYVNQHRVEEVIRLMESPAHNYLTLVGLALEAGFNSKATFNRAFKTITGVSPTAYKQKTT